MADEKQENPLGTAPITGLIVKYAVPTVISMLVTSAYNLTDQIFIGNVVGILGNAATGITFPVTILCIAFTQLAGVGTVASFNICMGRKNEAEAKGFVGTGLTMVVIIGVLLMAAVLLFKTPLLTLFGATESILPLSESYLGITGIGIPFLFFSGMASLLIRSDGSPAYSMMCTLSGAILNVLLDWLFMFPLAWGLPGAAFATVISQVVSFALAAFYFTRFKAFKIERAIFGLKTKYIPGIARLGSSNCINQLMLMAVAIAMNNSLRYYGVRSAYGSEIPLAVSGIIVKISHVLGAFAVGIALGCQPIFGFNMGAKNYGRLKETYKKALAVSLCVCVIAFLGFQFFPRQITGIFGVGSDLYFEFASRYLRIYLMMIFAFGVQPLSVNYFTSTGRARPALVITLSRQGFLLIPLIIILPLFFGIDGILYAGPIADVLAYMLSLFMVFRDFKQFDKTASSIKMQMPSAAV
ncbi:MAG: MATE family efflux transporter [Treponema sp.]|jgi:putative MATE family efflux protein|nr:MATE family efflux transporter [Treponema sp.]